MVTEDMNLLTTNICAISQQNQPTGIFIKENLADDVDAAATAMLVLKHGACAFDITPSKLLTSFVCYKLKRKYFFNLGAVLFNMSKLVYKDIILFILDKLL